MTRTPGTSRRRPPSDSGARSTLQSQMNPTTFGVWVMTRSNLRDLCHVSQRCAGAGWNGSCLHSLADLPQHIPLQELRQFQSLKRASADADAAFDAARLDHHRQEAAVGRLLTETPTGRGPHYDR